LRPQIRPVTTQGWASVLFFVERLFATVLFAHQAGDAGAVPLRGVEQVVPEGACAQAAHDGQIEADIDEGAAQRPAAHLALEFLQCARVYVGGVCSGGTGGCAKQPPGHVKGACRLSTNAAAMPLLRAKTFKMTSTIGGSAWNAH
jgi:hypothetical protein